MPHSNANMLEVIAERQLYKSPTHRLEISAVWNMTALSSIKAYFLKADDSQNLFSKQTWRTLFLWELILEIDMDENFLTKPKSEVVVQLLHYQKSKSSKMNPSSHFQ